MIGVVARGQVRELDQEVDVTGRRIEARAGGGAEQIEAPDPVAGAQAGDLGAVRVDARIHGETLATRWRPVQSTGFQDGRPEPVAGRRSLGARGHLRRRSGRSKSARSAGAERAGSSQVRSSDSVS